jgi:hypothetical protein
MRPVALRHIVTAVAVIVAISACGSTPSPHSTAKPTVSPPSAAASAVPGGNSVGPCNENTIPAFAPDFSKRGPLPGGGRNAKELWAKAMTLLKFTQNPLRLVYDPQPEYNLGLPFNTLPEQAGVICSNGDVYITGESGAIVKNAQLLNTVPNGGPTFVAGGRLYLHKASDAIGDLPCLAIIEIDALPGVSIRQTIASGDRMWIACTNNGAFIPHPNRE